eukprot:Awhi_evm2s15375
MSAIMIAVFLAFNVRNIPHRYNERSDPSSLTKSRKGFGESGNIMVSRPSRTKTSSRTTKVKQSSLANSNVIFKTTIDDLVEESYNERFASSHVYDGEDSSKHEVYDGHSQQPGESARKDKEKQGEVTIGSIHELDKRLDDEMN